MQAVASGSARTLAAFRTASCELGHCVKLEGFTDLRGALEELLQQLLADGPKPGIEPCRLLVQLA